METQEEVQVNTAFEPNADQVQRAAALRRFNLLFLYVPLALISVLVIGLLVFMFVKAIDQSDKDALRLISGLADIALIIAILPMLLVGVAILAALGYALSRGRSAESAPFSRTQRLFWRMDNLIVRARVWIQTTSIVAAKPFQSINGAITYLNVLFARLLRMVKRS